MDAIAVAELRARLLAEIAADPAYSGLSAADLTARLNAPVVVVAAPAYQDVPVSSVEGYMRLRKHIVRLTRWVAATQVDPDDAKNDARDFAEELLGMMAGGNVGYFQTSVPGKRAAILGAFGALAAVGAGGFNAGSVADLAAMTIAPAGPPEMAPARWSVLIEGLAEAPNAADAALVAELMA